MAGNNPLRISGSAPKPSALVPLARKHPIGAGPFPQPLQRPKLPKIKNRIYTKSVLQDDPMQFTNSGFGDTGLTGES